MRTGGLFISSLWFSLAVLHILWAFPGVLQSIEGNLVLINTHSLGQLVQLSPSAYVSAASVNLLASHSNELLNDVLKVIAMVTVVSVLAQVPSNFVLFLPVLEMGFDSLISEGRGSGFLLPCLYQHFIQCVIKKCVCMCYPFHCCGSSFTFKRHYKAMRIDQFCLFWGTELFKRLQYKNKFKM